MIVSNNFFLQYWMKSHNLFTEIIIKLTVYVLLCYETQLNSKLQIKCYIITIHNIVINI